jgi:hypothetical protein
MSARTIDKNSLHGSFSENSHCITLPEGAVQIHKNGIQFESGKPFAPWTEMTIRLQAHGQGKAAHFTGVVVDCAGSQRAGYQITMAFINMPEEGRMFSNPRAV